MWVRTGAYPGCVWGAQVVTRVLTGGGGRVSVGKEVRTEMRDGPGAKDTRHLREPGEAWDLGKDRPAAQRGLSRS